MIFSPNSRPRSFKWVYIPITCRIKVLRELPSVIAHLVLLRIPSAIKSVPRWRSSGKLPGKYLDCTNSSTLLVFLSSVPPHAYTPSKSSCIKSYTITLIAMDRPVPDYVYKIAVTPPPDPLPHSLALSELDQTDGFIHLSNATQIPITASLFFPSNTTVYLLRVSSVVAQEEGQVFKWLDEGQTGCIHLYGANGVKGEFGRLGLGTVTGVKVWKRREGKRWDDKGVVDSLHGWLKDSE